MVAIAKSVRVYTVYVVREREGRVVSHCITERRGQAKQTQRVYRKSYPEPFYSVEEYPVASRKEARAFRIPPAGQR